MTSHNEIDLKVGVILARYNIQVSARLRPQLRPLDYITYHKTFVNELGNFLALVTDGTIAWIRLSNDKETVITVQLANIAQPIERSVKSTSSFKPPKPPSVRTLAKLQALLDLGDEFLTPQQHNILKQYSKQ
jgi:hypothetical protein